MVEPVNLQTVLTYLTLISIPVGVIYHIMTLRNTRKTRELTLRARAPYLYSYGHSFYGNFNHGLL